MNPTLPNTNPQEHIICYDAGEGYVSGEALLVARCSCGLEKAAYTNGNEIEARFKLSKAFAALHQHQTVQHIVAAHGPVPTTTESDCSDGMEDRTLGG